MSSIAPPLKHVPSMLILREKKERSSKIEASKKEQEEEEKIIDSRAIETIEEFHTILECFFAQILEKEGRLKEGELSEEEVLELIPKISMDGWVFQECDFSKEPLNRWELYDLKGASFWGCTLPEGIQTSTLNPRGATAFDNNPRLPFRPARAFMYTQQELIIVDDKIYQFYKSKTTLGDRIAQSLHDFSIADSLDDYMEARTAVGIMGGHSLWRHSPEYAKIVYLCREIAKLGFIVVTGGGPGAMEAANLGAYLYQNTDEEVEEALKMIGKDRDESGANYIIETAQAVLDRFGFPSHQPSLGIPTYYYGHEPTNKFATFHAKYFSNALREADLLRVCGGGIIFTRGAAGTRQEIFQYACQNHYAKEGMATPMIFFGEEWWKNGGVYQLVQNTAQGREYKKHLLCTDDIKETANHLYEHAKEKNLKLLTPEELKEPFWVAEDLREAYKIREEKHKGGSQVKFRVKAARD